MTFLEAEGLVLSELQKIDPKEYPEVIRGDIAAAIPRAGRLIDFSEMYITTPEKWLWEWLGVIEEYSALRIATRFDDFIQKLSNPALS